MALSGMTGFSRIEGAAGDWTWAVEARSVNGRNLEVRFRGPPTFEALERAARDAAQARFQRGQINLGVQAKRSESAGAPRIDTARLEALLAAIDPYVRDGRAQPPAIEGLLALRGVLASEEGEEDPQVLAEVQAAMAASIAAAVDGLKAARLEEGAALTPVLQGLVDRIESLVAAAEHEAAAQPGTLKERYERRLAELIGDRGLSEDRIVQEAAALALKADVREELDRLAGHIGQARGLFAQEGPAGRRLDFLTQEFMREVNTLCSKSATAALTSIGLDLKAAVEQLREQVQNVE